MIAVRRGHWSCRGSTTAGAGAAISSAHAAHLFGYVSEVNEAQLTRGDYKELERRRDRRPGRRGAGVQQAVDGDGGDAVIVNSRGREIRRGREEEPPGRPPLQLTIDADLQKAAEDGFAHFGIINAGAYNGAAVILHPQTGEVLSLVSLPAYDPNKFAVGIDAATWRR